MAMTTYPLNNVQYNAEDAELYNAVRMSGVWSGSAFDAEVTGNDMFVTIGEGLAWIANTKFSGKVVAQKEPKVIDLGVADPSYNRIDVIAIQFDSVENKTDIIVKKGVASSSPEIPTRSTTESLYELYLYSVLRTVGSSVVSKSNITDLRDNREYCGYMQDSIKPGYAPSLMEHNNGEDFRFWVGTEAEYEREKDSILVNTFCVITDDGSDQGTDGIWTYEKWSNGVSKCWASFQYNIKEITFLKDPNNNNTYKPAYCGVKNDFCTSGMGIKFPNNLFVDIPFVNYDAANGTGKNGLAFGQGMAKGAKDVATKEYTGALYVDFPLGVNESDEWKVTNTTNQSTTYAFPSGEYIPCQISIEAKGRWK